jgi:hypothetical protein
MYNKLIIRHSSRLLLKTLEVFAYAGSPNRASDLPEPTVSGLSKKLDGDITSEVVILG